MKWPKAEEAMQVENGFRQQHTFPGVLGDIDYCHIPILASAEDQHYYTNSKKFPTCFFNDSFAGWPDVVMTCICT